MARTFKPVRFFVLIALVAAVFCGITAFYTQRAAHGHTAAERAAYSLGEKAGEDVVPGAKLPSAAELNMIAQARFKQEGSGEPESWDLAFENGYEAGFTKTHPAP